MSILKQGEIVVVTYGVYSDYRILKVCRVLKDFNPKDPIHKPDPAPWYETPELGFEKLVSDGYLEPFDTKELWLADEWDAHATSI